MKQWMRSGLPMIWLNAGALAISLIAVFGLLILIAVRGLSHFWPATVYEFNYVDPNGGDKIQLVGEIHSEELLAPERLAAAGIAVPENMPEITRYLLKVGNRDAYGIDFRQVYEYGIKGERSVPHDMLVIERHEWGNAYGQLLKVYEKDQVVAEGPQAIGELQARLQRAIDLHDQIKDIEKHDIGAINYDVEQLRLKQRRLELNGDDTPERIAELDAERARLAAEYKILEDQLVDLYVESKRDAFEIQIMDGRTRKIDVANAVRIYQPNAMTTSEKIGFYFAKVWEFVSDEPREANTEGGVFPAIFGTVMMVLIMAVIVTPFGVVAAVYLREYAKQGPLTRVIRIAVNNLAGVPSIVYGVFGLGFFVYFLGGNIDELFYPEAKPAPVFGTPGIIWAALTLAILTLPVVIVSTEEGLSRIPRALREGSLALGATKLETLWKVVLPMSSPAMMTGLVLAIARAAGEVAPLMLVGVVKLAPNLPLDGNAPFLHLDRKFMHLGFHIYDVGFQSPNVEAARPLVYATSLLLVLVIIALNLTAIQIRNRLREKYRALDQ